MACASFAATLIATRRGPAIGSDSVTYLSVADNLARTFSLADNRGDALTAWPLGYPALLAAGHALGIGLELWARLLNGLAFAALAPLAYFILRPTVRTRAAALAGTAFVALSPVILGVAEAPLADVVFTALVAATMLVLCLLIAKGLDRPLMLVGLGLLVSACFLVRYAGFAIGLAVALLLLFPLGTAPREISKRTAARLAWFLSGAVVPALLWMAWARQHRENGLSDRASIGRATFDGIPATIGQLVDDLASWLAPDEAPRPLRLLALAFVVLLVGAGIGIAVRRRAQHALPPPLWVAATFVACYTSIVFVVVSGRAEFEGRYALPMLVPTVVVATFGLETLYGRIGDRRPRIAVVVAGGLALWLVLIGVWFAATSIRQGNVTRGYRSAAWQESALLAATRAEADPTTDLVYSNRANAVDFVLRLPHTDWTSRIGVGPWAATASVRAHLVDNACDHPVLVAWFTDPDNAFSVNQPLARWMRLARVARVADGTLYEAEFKDAEARSTLCG